MKKVKNIAKNTSYFTLALVLQKLVSFSYFVILARYLGPADLGKYYFAISFTSIFQIFIDIGLANVLMREVSRLNEKEGDQRPRINAIISKVISLEIILSLLVLAVATITINLLGYPEITTHLVYISAISMVLNTFTTSFYAASRAHHNLKYESVGSVAFQLLVFALGITFLQLNLGLKALMAALAGASVFNFIFSYLVLKYRWGVSIKLDFKFAVIKPILWLAAPFALFAIFQKAYMFFDTVLLSLLSTDTQVGLYQIPFKIVFALQFLPLAFVAALYPAMSSYWINNKEQLKISFERALNYLIIISLPISIGVIATADEIVKVFRQGYGEAVLPMQIVMLALVFIFINFPIGSLLNACERQKRNTLNMGIVFFVSLALNLILIPKYQAVGASITVLATNFLMFILGIGAAFQVVSIRSTRILKIFAKTLTAALVMGLGAFILKDYMNIFITVGISGIFYFVLLYAFKAFRAEDILSIWNSFVKKSNL